MKIAQYYDKDRISLGRVEDENLIPLDFKGDMLDLINSRSNPKASGEPLPLEEVRFAPPVSRPSKIIGIGLNYQDHIKESKGKVPELPLIFAKFPNTLLGHKGRITWDSNLTRKVDFEAELAVIIGKTICGCPEDRAMEAVFGYTCGNDVSARDLQFGDGQWVRGKTLDTFCPLGPWIVTSDEIADPHSLGIRSLLNGRIMQDSNIGLMLFNLPSLISFLSKNFTLIPGDVILSGTPHGVGCFREPPVYMKDGDEIIVEIEGVGRLENICVTC
ncbi:fumarylacetoacetate hydrolase family protein [Deltaproteobacteria bacterium]|nr:fumarylacetoacetate hydrolase family protein [Deltaproteobacteria bacterium]